MTAFDSVAFDDVAFDCDIAVLSIAFTHPAVPRRRLPDEIEFERMLNLRKAQIALEYKREMARGDEKLNIFAALPSLEELLLREEQKQEAEREEARKKRTYDLDNMYQRDVALAKAQEANAAKRERQDEIAEQRLANLAKARGEVPEPPQDVFSAPAHQPVQASQDVFAQSFEAIEAERQRQIAEQRLMNLAKAREARHK